MSITFQQYVTGQLASTGFAILGQAPPIGCVPTVLSEMEAAYSVNNFPRLLVFLRGQPGVELHSLRFVGDGLSHVIGSPLPDNLEQRITWVIGRQVASIEPYALTPKVAAAAPPATIPQITYAKSTPDGTKSGAFRTLRGPMQHERRSVSVF